MVTSIQRLILVLFLSVSCISQTAVADTSEELKLSGDEQAIVDLTNKAREKEKLPALKPNPVLFKVARAHSANMAKQKKMEHVLDDKNPADRLKAADYKYEWMGENVAAGNGWSLEDVFKTWMDSKLHKENIMNKDFREIGIGIARDKDDKVYFTQLFGTPKKKK
jgi:uncharacterized protein YkwD